MYNFSIEINPTNNPSGYTWIIVKHIDLPYTGIHILAEKTEETNSLGKMRQMK